MRQVTATATRVVMSLGFVGTVGSQSQVTATVTRVVMSLGFMGTVGSKSQVTEASIVFRSFVLFGHLFICKICKIDWP